MTSTYRTPDGKIELTIIGDKLDGGLLNMEHVIAVAFKRLPSPTDIELGWVTLMVLKNNDCHVDDNVIYTRGHEYLLHDLAPSLTLVSIR